MKNMLTGKFFKERVSLKRFFIFKTIFIAGISMILNIVLTIALVYVVVTKKVYMQPPFLLDSLTELDYKKGKLYKETLESFAEAFIAYTENLTPDNAEVRTKKAKHFLSTEFYPTYSNELDKRVIACNKNNMTRSFHIDKNGINTLAYGTLVISGVRSKQIGSTPIVNQGIKLIIHYNWNDNEGIEIQNVEEK